MRRAAGPKRVIRLDAGCPFLELRFVPRPTDVFRQFKNRGADVSRKDALIFRVGAFLEAFGSVFEFDDLRIVPDDAVSLPDSKNAALVEDVGGIDLDRRSLVH